MIKDKQESNARKAKGEKLQKHIVTEVKSRFPDHAASIKSSKMSAHGEDIKITSDEARSAHMIFFGNRQRQTWGGGQLGFFS